MLLIYCKHRNRKEINKFYKLFAVLLIAGVPIILIVAEPDLGTASSYIFATILFYLFQELAKKYIIAAILIICSFSAYNLYEFATTCSF